MQNKVIYNAIIGFFFLIGMIPYNIRPCFYILTFNDSFWKMFGNFIWFLKILATTKLETTKSINPIRTGIFQTLPGPGVIFARGP